MTHPEITSLCNRFRRELKLLLVRLALSRFVVAAVALLTVLVGADWYLRFGYMGRSISLAIFAAGIVFLIVREWIRPLRRRWNDREILAYLDANDPEHRDALTNALEMEQSEEIGEAVTPEGREIIEHAIAQLKPALANATLANAFQRRAVQRWQMAMLSVMAIVALACIPFHTVIGTGLARLFLPLANIRWSALTTLEVVEPSTGWLIPQGEDFTLVTRVNGQRPPELELSYEGSSSGYWITEHVAINADGAANYTFKEVNEPVTFFVKGGDDETNRYHLGVTEKPRIKAITAFYEYPPYAQLQNQKIVSGQVRGLEGTKVRLEFESTTPLKSALFSLDGKADENLPLTSKTAFSKAFVLLQDGHYAVKLTGENGFREFRPEIYTIQVIPDNPPEVKITSPGKDIVATSQANMTLAFEAGDDFGLTSVKFMQSADNAADPQSLTDHVTGPIAQAGKKSSAQFTWDFAKLELKKNTSIEYFVLAVDCNPTGRGKTESAHFKIDLLQPTDFHNRILFEARKILAEARLGFKNQKDGYLKGLAWTRQPSEKTNDEKWGELVTLQDSSVRAMQALGRWLAELDEHIERNRMQDDFMKTRLVAIEDSWKAASASSSQIQSSFTQVHPRNAAEAEATALQNTRLGALKKSKPAEETAVIAMGKLLRKMYDWENLQTALVDTKLLREREADIYERTRQLGGKTVGKAIEDLDDATQDQVLLLGKQQSSACDQETALEASLARLALEAENQGRLTTMRHLVLALGMLKNDEVNARLKKIIEKINNNHLTNVTDDQDFVVSKLKVVEGLLMKAAKDVQDEHVDAAAMLEPDKDVQTVATTNAPAATADDMVYKQEAVDKLLREMVPAGDDALSQSLLTLANEQDRIKVRTKDLNETGRAADMPRYKKLKLGMLEWRETEVKTYATKEIEPLIEKSELSAPMKTQFGAIVSEIGFAVELFKAAELSDLSQKLHEDITESSKDVAQFIAREKHIHDMAAEHTKNDGKDSFSRPYLIKNEDLKKALDVYQQLDRNEIFQRRINRMTAWLSLAVEKSPPSVTPIASQVTSDTGEKQASVATQVETVKAVETSFGPDVKDSLHKTGIHELPGKQLSEVATLIREGKIDAAVKATQGQAEGKIVEVLGHLKELMDERQAQVDSPVPSTEAAADTTAAPAQPEQKLYVTEEEAANEMTPAAIKSALEANKQMPAEIKSRMLNAIPSQFPDKYRRLVGAYYHAIIDPNENGEKSGEKKQ